MMEIFLKENTMLMFNMFSTKEHFHTNSIRMLKKITMVLSFAFFSMSNISMGTTIFEYLIRLQ